LLWLNEFESIDEIISGKLVSDVDPKDTKKKDGDESNRTDISKIVVRYPSPATLNMTNLADAINQGQPVAEFIVTNVTKGSQDETIKAFVMGRVIKDIMPQIQWAKYEQYYQDALTEKAREDAGKGGSTDSSTAM
jgi:hypothetical protein